MRKKIFLIFSGILLFAFVLDTSFLWYKVFYYGDLGTVSNLQVQKESDESTLNENLFPMTKEEASIVPNYEFSIKFYRWNIFSWCWRSKSFAKFGFE